MTVRDLLAKLREYNPDAEVMVVAHCQSYPFTLAWGGRAEGDTKEKCCEVSFYVDALCADER